MSSSDSFDESEPDYSNIITKGDLRDEIPGYRFLQTIDRYQIAIAAALLWLVRDPIAFIRIYLLEGLLTILVSGFFRGMESVMRGFAAAWVYVGQQLWYGSFGFVAGLARATADMILIPLSDLVHSFAVDGLTSLGVAAPAAAAVATGVTTLMFIALGVALYELAATYLPVKAIVRAITPIGAFFAAVFGGVLSTIVGWISGLFGGGS